MYLLSIWGYIQTIRVEAISKFQLKQFKDYSKKNFKNIAKILLEGDLGHSWVEYDGILSFKGPFIDSSSELSITDYDQDDYYGDGYTFLRTPLNKLKILEKKNIIDHFDEDLFIVSIQSDYGSSFTSKLSKKNQKFDNDQFSINSLNLHPIINTSLLKTLSYKKKKLPNSSKHGFENHDLKVFIVEKNKSNHINVIDKSSVIFK
tara:strand:+ start:1453 stop:2064 length:612 start_codon:yes stop_codon:yes gene_type:complete